jgi:hypothetical protein
MGMLRTSATRRTTLLYILRVQTKAEAVALVSSSNPHMHLEFSPLRR